MSPRCTTPGAGARNLKPPAIQPCGDELPPLTAAIGFIMAHWTMFGIDLLEVLVVGIAVSLIFAGLFLPTSTKTSCSM